MNSQKVVLITGTSSGVGQATARLLSLKGYRVLGTSRNPSRAEPMPNVEMLALDVRDDDSVAACVNAIADRTGRLDVLVNNAGYELAGALEEVSLDEAKAQFETNFFGMARMTKAVLPIMRQQEGGQIINISSLAGLTPVPFMGIYSASKFAVEGYTEALRLEVRPFDIHVSQIEVSFLRTTMMNNRQIATERISAYEPWRQLALDAIREYEETGPGPELVAEAVLRIIGSRKPPLRYVIGRKAKSTVRLRRILPQRVFENGLRSTFRVDAR